jgi:hypothetical protein
VREREGERERKREKMYLLSVEEMAIGIVCETGSDSSVGICKSKWRMSESGRGVANIRSNPFSVSFPFELFGQARESKNSNEFE